MVGGKRGYVVARSLDPDLFEHQAWLIRILAAIQKHTAVRFEPGETRTVSLVAIAGRRVIRGGNDFAREYES